MAAIQAGFTSGGVLFLDAGSDSREGGEGVRL
jgi:hypothetical protein